MGIALLEHSFHLTADFALKGGMNRWGGLLCLSDNPCLQGGGIACLQSREFDGVLGFGDYDGVEAWSKAD